MNTISHWQLFAASRSNRIQTIDQEVKALSLTNNPVSPQYPKNTSFYRNVKKYTVVMV